MPYRDPEKKRKQNREWIRKWRAEHPEEAKARSRECSRKLRALHPESVKAMNDKCREYQKDWRKANPGKCRAWYAKHERTSRRKAKLTDLVRQLLGGMCKCCGEATKDFLTVDHINNDRAKIVKSGVKHGNWHYYSEIKRAFESNDVGAVRIVKSKYQILCYNCNLSKRVGGVCAHRRGDVTKHPEFPYASATGGHG